MKNKSLCLSLSAVTAPLLLLAGLVWAMMLVSGCFSPHDRLVYEPREDVVVPPSFLAGAAGVLLTNAAGFSAQLTEEPPMLTNKAHIVTGLLLGQGSHLLFSPKGGDRTFIWDVNEHTGWVLSEALQGYAPISSVEQFTNIVILSGAAGPSSDRVNGHPGHEEQLAVASNNGSNVKFSIWRASDLNGLPVRIKVLDVNHLATIQLSDARREVIVPKLFLPPEGFTKYASAEAMADEVFARKAKIRNVPVSGPGVPTEKPLPQSPTRGY